MKLKQISKTFLIFIIGCFAGTTGCLIVMDKKVDDIVVHQSLLERNVFLGNLLSDINYISGASSGAVTCDIVQRVFLKHSKLLFDEANKVGESKIPLVNYLAYAQSLIERSEKMKSDCSE